MGLFGNGRYFEHLIQKLKTHPLTELQEIGKDSFQELNKVIPSFIRRADVSNKYFISYSQFVEQVRNDVKILAKVHSPQMKEGMKPGVSLISYDSDCLYKMAGALLFEYSEHSLKELQDYCKKLPEEDLLRIFDSVCIPRENRRHKSSRALETVFFTFEMLCDFGIYRDLERHRMLSQQRQLLTCQYGYFIPSEILGTEMEKEYVLAMDCAKKAYDTIAAELPEEAQYVVPMAYNVPWYFHINLRSLQWLTELRSAPAGHSSYRLVAQEMVKQVCAVFPQLERFFKFVNFDGYDLGRMDQEIRRSEKKREG